MLSEQSNLFHRQDAQVKSPKNRAACCSEGMGRLSRGRHTCSPSTHRRLAHPWPCHE